MAAVFYKNSEVKREKAHEIFSLCVQILEAIQDDPQYKAQERQMRELLNNITLEEQRRGL